MFAKTFAVISTLSAAATVMSPSPQASAENPTCLPSGICAFLSPSGHISCEMTSHYYQMPDSAYCQWIDDRGAGFSVTMHPDGTFASCLHDGCLGNPGENTPTLPYGDSATIGPFTCVSRTSGVTCTATASGRGFIISDKGIAPFG